MTRLVALLRGVNVGGHNKLPMADLRTIVEDCGYGPAQTYIQSGNVVLSSATDGPDDVAGVLRASIAEAAGIDTSVIVRTAGELSAVVARSPYLARGEDPAHLHVLFLSGEVTPDLSDLDRFAPDEATVVDREIHLYLPDGPGRSKLAEQLTRKGGSPGTMRNWRTVTKLVEMSTAPG